MSDQPKIGSRWLHLKRGTSYEVISLCTIEASEEVGVVYRAEISGATWVRPVSEFMDGRFHLISKAEETYDSAMAKLKSGQSITPREAYLYMLYHVNVERANARQELYDLARRFETRKDGWYAPNPIEAPTD
jgi:hypothetical protein